MAVQALAGNDTVKSELNEAYEGLNAVFRREWGESAPIAT
jgi:hypothetical protein